MIEDGGSVDLLFGQVTGTWQKDPLFLYRLSKAKRANLFLT